jgi:hypothetical protein
MISAPYRCYLGVSLEPDTATATTQVKEALARLGVSIAAVTSAESISRLPEKDGILSAQFAIFVLSAHPAQATILEIGVALGASRPMLLLAPPDVQLPLLLQGVPLLERDIAADALSFQLEAFIKSLPRPDARPKRVRSRSLSDAANAGWPISTNAVEATVFQSLERLGWRAVPLSGSRHQSATGWHLADAAFWAPEVEPLNPVIIEISAGRRPLEDMQAQLFSVLHATGLHLGLLVVEGHKGPPEILVRDQVGVLSTSTDSLRDLSPVSPVVRALIHTRNQLVHSSPS